ncbi:MAG: type II secretion system F family protein [Legionellales bacterium]|nr:type II secretion system F family protein [Legionellales bacterium]
MAKKAIYIARNQKGELVNGEFTDITERILVAKRLRDQNLIPVTIDIVSSSSGWRNKLNLELTDPKVYPKDLHLFCRQMYTMLKSGIPVTNALKRLAESTKNSTLRRTLFKMCDDVAGGQSISVVFKQFPNIFPPILRHIIGVGEQTGRLEEAFERVGEYISLELETVARLKKVMRYPIIVVVAISIAIVIVNIFVVPAFAKLFKSFSADLPIFTKILIAFSDFMLANWGTLLGVLIVTIFSFRYFISKNYGRQIFDRLQLKIPAVGPVLEKILLARFARTMVMILKTGVPLNEGIDMIANSIGNTHFKKSINKIKEKMESGESLGASSKDVGLFPRIALQMIVVGEDSGELDRMMEEIALYYEREVDYEIDRIGDIIEPVLLVFIGVMVLFLALGVFLPIWELGAAAQGK